MLPLLLPSLPVHLYQIPFGCLPTWRPVHAQGWLSDKYYAEDYVLGLQLMQGPWQSRLLQEYLVIQKGPPTLGAAYHTKYREAINQFQVGLC